MFVKTITEFFESDERVKRKPPMCSLSGDFCYREVTLHNLNEVLFPYMRLDDLNRRRNDAHVGRGRVRASGRGIRFARNVVFRFCRILE